MSIAYGANHHEYHLTIAAAIAALLLESAHGCARNSADRLDVRCSLRKLPSHVTDWAHDLRLRYWLPHAETICARASGNRISSELGRERKAA